MSKVCRPYRKVQISTAFFLSLWPISPRARHSALVQTQVMLPVETKRLCLLPALSLRPNSFVIITANRVLHCNADTPEEMHHWITLLQRSKGDTRVEGQEFIVRGDCHRRSPFSRSPVFIRMGVCRVAILSIFSRVILTLEVAKNIKIRNECGHF